jgi:hypothetical protein
MFISIRRYRQGAGTAADLAKKVEDEFVPMVSDVPGFVGYYVIDAGDNVVASVNVFEAREGAEESDRRAKEWVPGALAEFEPSDVEIIEGEVLVSK